MEKKTQPENGLKRSRWRRTLNRRLEGGHKVSIGESGIDPKTPATPSGKRPQTPPIKCVESAGVFSVEFQGTTLFIEEIDPDHIRFYGAKSNVEMVTRKNSTTLPDCFQDLLAWAMFTELIGFSTLSCLAQEHLLMIAPPDVLPLIEQMRLVAAIFATNGLDLYALKELGGFWIDTIVGGSVLKNRANLPDGREMPA